MSGWKRRLAGEGVNGRSYYLFIPGSRLQDELAGTPCRPFWVGPSRPCVLTLQLQVEHSHLAALGSAVQIVSIGDS